MTKAISLQAGLHFGMTVEVLHSLFSAEKDITILFKASHNTSMQTTLLFIAVQPHALWQSHLDDLGFNHDQTKLTVISDTKVLYFDACPKCLQSFCFSLAEIHHWL